MARINPEIIKKAKIVFEKAKEMREYYEDEVCVRNAINELYEEDSSWGQIATVASGYFNKYCKEEREREERENRELEKKMQEIQEDEDERDFLKEALAANYHLVKEEDIPEKYKEVIEKYKESILGNTEDHAWNKRYRR